MDGPAVDDEVVVRTLRPGGEAMNKHQRKNAGKKVWQEEKKSKDDTSSGCLLCKAWERRMVLGVYVPNDIGKPTATSWLCLACTMSPDCKARVEEALRERFGCDC
jgi:hypothetical protein